MGGVTEQTLFSLIIQRLYFLKRKSATLERATHMETFAIIATPMETFSIIPARGARAPPAEGAFRFGESTGEGPPCIEFDAIQ